jgi:hypothetical protein
MDTPDIDDNFQPLSGEQRMEPLCMRKENFYEHSHYWRNRFYR